MMAFILDELSEWRNEWGPRSVSILLGLVFVSLLLSQFELIVFVMAMAIWFVGFGWMVVNRGEHRRNAWSWVVQQGLTPMAWVLGKIAVYVLLSILHLAITVPVLMLVGASWGIPAWDLALTMLAAMSAGAMVCTLGLVSGANDRVSGDLLNLALVGAWLITGLVLEFLHAWSPFFQIWELVQHGARWEIVIHLLGNLGLMAVWAFFAAFILRLSIRKPA